MPNVKTVQDRTKGALLILDDGVKVWTPDKELARTLLGKPIPDDWTRRENENGPMALPPKPKGGGGFTAWRNTKEGFDAEAAGRRRWQEIEEEKRDRRTALMQAVVHMDEAGIAAILLRADNFYEWLRSSPVQDQPSLHGQAQQPTPTGAGDTSSVDDGEASADTGPGGAKTEDDIASPGSTTCNHKGASGRWLPTKVVDGQATCPRCGMSALIYRETSA